MVRILGLSWVVCTLAPRASNLLHCPYTHVSSGHERSYYIFCMPAENQHPTLHAQSKHSCLSRRDGLHDTKNTMGHEKRTDPVIRGRLGFQSVLSWKSRHSTGQPHTSESSKAPMCLKCRTTCVPPSAFSACQWRRWRPGHDEHVDSVPTNCPASASIPLYVDHWFQFSSNESTHLQQRAARHRDVTKNT